MKKLVIIHGVTGAIGSACLSFFASNPDFIVYGISRKAKDFREFCVKGKLPVATLICSITSETYIPRIATIFSESIDADQFSEIYYVHALGVYPFEIDKNGNRLVHNDNDGDGIDDRCTELTLEMFSSFYVSLASRTKKNVLSFIFGGIADKHEPLAHMSWWKTMKVLKDEIVRKSEKTKNLQAQVAIVNISSVLCPNELITRPFVFTETDADPTYWLQPMEVVQFLGHILMTGQKECLKEYELFKKKPDFDEHYYENEVFTPRKVTELFGKK